MMKGFLAIETGRFGMEARDGKAMSMVRWGRSAGFTLIETKTREEAYEWTKRFPNPGFDEGEIEVRELYSLDDFDSPEVERFRKMEMKSQQ